MIIFLYEQYSHQNKGDNGSSFYLSTTTIPSYNEFEPGPRQASSPLTPEFEPGPRQASSPLTPESPKQFLNHVDRGVYVIKDISEDPGVRHQNILLIVVYCIPTIDCVN
jgi:hypothetical protein